MGAAHIPERQPYPDTRISITLQLTAGAEMRKKADKVNSIMVNDAEVSEMSGRLNAIYRSEDTETSSRVTTVGKEAIEHARKEREEHKPTIQFSEAVTALRQGKVEAKQPTKKAMLSKRLYDGDQHESKKRIQIDNIKARTRPSSTSLNVIEA